MFKGKESIDASIKYFSEQLRVVEVFLDSVKLSRKTGRVEAVLPLLVGIVTAGKAIIILINEKYASEAFVMARCFLERTVNYSYLMVADEKEIKSFIDHGIQKGYQATSSKKKTFNSLGNNFKINKPNMWLQAKINNFTKKGRPTNWTSLTFRKRLEAIDKYCDEFDVSFYGNLYEDASESAHGSFYGNLVHTGILSEVTNPGAGLQYVNAYVSLILCKLADLVIVAFKATASTGNYDLSEYMKTLDKNCNDINSFFKQMQASEP